MAKRRDQIRMTDDELWSFIESQKTIQVATLNQNGTPHLMPLWFAIEDRTIILETFTKSQKIRNLKRDPRITVLVEDGEQYEELRGVEIVGTAEVTEDPEVVMPVARSVVERYFPIENPDDLEAVAIGLAHKRSAVIINAEKVVSWDHSKLGGTY